MREALVLWGISTVLVTATIRADLLVRYGRWSEKIIWGGDGWGGDGVTRFLTTAFRIMCGFVAACFIAFAVGYTIDAFRA